MKTLTHFSVLFALALGESPQIKRGITTQADSIGQGGDISVDIFAPGYIATYIIAILIIGAHLAHMCRRFLAFRSLPASCASFQSERLTQIGFRRSRVGRLTRWSLLLFALWLQVAIVLSIVGHYEGHWVFDPTLPQGAVDWDSYTRIFLMAWSCSILIAVCCRIFRNQLLTFYMLPCELRSAICVQMTQVVVDRNFSKNETAVNHQETIEVHYDEIRYVDFLLRRYIWSEDRKAFVHRLVFTENAPMGSEAAVILHRGGSDMNSVKNRRSYVGKNDIVFNVPSLLRMAVEEISSFFYIYQICSCWLPAYWDYLTVALLTLVLVLVSATIKIRMEYKQKLLLRDMATLKGRVWVKRELSWALLESEDLVPGDLICLSANSENASREVVADCLLVSGHAILDEAALSGETMPVQKFPVPVSDHRRLPEDTENKKYYLFAGTTLLQSGGLSSESGPPGVSDGALAIVSSTGAHTLRGSMIRGLIYGANYKSRLFIELRISVGILALIALIDFFTLSSRFDMSISSMLTAMYSIIGLINPLMAVALVAGELQSAKRLKNNFQHKIHTRDLHRLTIAGRTNVALLDKTGTISKSTLDFHGVVAVANLRLADTISEYPDNSSELSIALALTHSVGLCNKQLIGHQVELRMVETSQQLGWKYGSGLRGACAPNGTGYVVDRLFPFSHETMTMSVIVSNSAGRFVFCKGSFEALKPRCTEVPVEATEVVNRYAEAGCYVIAVATKPISRDLANHEIRREDVETDLRFIGLILFRNELKDDSREAISELQTAGISVKMITGDSIYTGAAVAKLVGIIPPDSRVVFGTINPRTRCVEWKLAGSGTIVSDVSLRSESSVSLCITGEAFALLSSQETSVDLDATKVYGRVSPNQKAEVVKLHMARGDVVATCGDGANDSSCLRASSAGLALCGRTEASISAPFSTDSESLMSLNLLIREARAALCTSLASYQSLVVIGILYCISKSILLFQAAAYQAGLAYLYLDLLTTPLMLYAIVHALPSKKLVGKAPEGSLLGGQLIVSCIWSIFVCITFLILADVIMVSQEWYVPFKAADGVGLEEWQKRGNNFEAALVFIWCAWVYVDVPLTYATGGMHRRPFYTNWRLLLTCCFLFGTTIAVLFVHAGEFGCWFKVACTERESLAASESFVNYFLFPYEKVGGTWWNSDIQSTEYPIGFKVGLFFLLLTMSILHHAGHHLIHTKLVTILHDRLGWDGSCFRRRRKSSVVSGLIKKEATGSTIPDLGDETMKTSLRNVN
jgi:predicted P-type ATPase